MPSIDSHQDTTITLKKSVRDKLTNIGTKDDSFNDIVDRLADFWIRDKHVVKEK